MTIKQWTNDIQYSPQSIFNWLVDLLNKFTAAFLHEGISVILEWLLPVGFWCQTIHKTFLRRFDTIFGLKMMMKSGLENIISKFHHGLQSCYCPVPKNLPRKAELAWQVSRYLWSLKIIFSWPLFIIIFKPKMVSNQSKIFLWIAWHYLKTYSECW